MLQIEEGLWCLRQVWSACETAAAQLPIWSSRQECPSHAAPRLRPAINPIAAPVVVCLAPSQQRPRPPLQDFIDSSTSFNAYCNCFVVSMKDTGDLMVISPISMTEEAVFCKWAEGQGGRALLQRQAKGL